MSDTDFDYYLNEISDEFDEIRNDIVNFSNKNDMSSAKKKTSKLSEAARRSTRNSKSSGKKFDDLHDHEDTSLETPTPPKKKEIVTHEYHDLHSKKGDFEVPKSI